MAFKNDFNFKMLLQVEYIQIHCGLEDIFSYILILKLHYFTQDIAFLKCKIYTLVIRRTFISIGNFLQRHTN